ncbi:alcohol dehydrogenase catalytic domain-containing protein [Nocardioides sp. NPDC047086]|uniref:alcohol dehydrogenase catalytic domain-containing protein n=1 Tax=Nocardioides sp. NPDC047086 TaxID=3154810 RepID=UPI00340770B5
MSGGGTATQVLLTRGIDTPAELVAARLDAPREDEVLVRIEAVGLCHTDLATRAALGATPAVLGHEGCGIVEQVGAAVSAASGIRVGERVVLSFRSCGSCERCLGGAPAYCEQAQRLNSAGRRPDGSATVTVDGRPVFASFFGQSSFASHALVAADACVPVGEAAPEVAAPLGCGLLTGAGAVLNVLRPGAGDRLLVVGAGGVGAAAVLAARSEGVEVVVVEPLASRRELVASFGAKACESLDELADPGISHALDTSGRPEIVDRVLGLLDPLGTLAVVGLGPARAEIDVRRLMLRGLTLRGCVEGDAVPRELVPELLRRHAAGTLPLDRLVTTFPLSEWDEAVAAQRAGRVLKPVMLP